MKQLALVLVFTFAAPAFAEKIDLSTSTCKQFVEGSDADIKTTLAWLDGYYKDEDAPPVIDTDELVANAKALGTFCRNNPTLGLITAADKVLGKWGRRCAIGPESPFHNVLASRLTRIMAAARTKKASAEDGVAS